MSTTWNGTHYLTDTKAALGWAAAALPDPSVIGREEDARVAAENLEAYCYREAAKLPESDVATVDGEPMDEDTWRSLCRAALVWVITESRS